MTKTDHIFYLPGTDKEVEEAKVHDWSMENSIQLGTLENCSDKRRYPRGRFDSLRSATELCSFRPWTDLCESGRISKPLTINRRLLVPSPPPKSVTGKSS
jgi:hypothetical protein